MSRRTAVVCASASVVVVPRPMTSIAERAKGALVVSHQGTLAVADVAVGAETITLISMYAAWETVVTGRSSIYADAAAHRLLSDLSGIVTSRGGHRIIAAGDLNILNRYGEHGNAYWAARYASVFDRAEATGLRFVGPQAPHGRQASPWPDELPKGSLDVPTYHTSRQGPMGAARQLDFVFASNTLASRLTVRALNTDFDSWGPSDHCRVEIELR